MRGQRRQAGCPDNLLAEPAKRPERKVIGYRVAIVRPYGPTGDELEVTPTGAVHVDQAAAELAAEGVDHAHVIELHLGGLSSADPAGPPLSNRWRMVCTGENWELPFTTWQSAARTVDRIERHKECGESHQVVTSHSNVIDLFASCPASE
ncbi:hypothetical protein [Nonomuraea maritima]|uniref:hypothetical protein n=1 Tax=Nonomuraea maritima TaxID=683260 RepID=UPI00371D3BE0